MTFGLDFGLKDSIEKLGSITAELRSVADELRGVEQDGRKAGDGIADGMEDAAGSAEGLGKEVDGAADKIKGIGEETEKAKTKVLSATEEMGARFQESMGSSLNLGKVSGNPLKVALDQALVTQESRPRLFLMTVIKN